MAVPFRSRDAAPTVPGRRPDCEPDVWSAGERPRSFAAARFLVHCRKLGGSGRGLMYTVGDEEAAAIAAAIRDKALFRYGVGNQCDRFEQRYASYLGVKHFALA